MGKRFNRNIFFAFLLFLIFSNIYSQSKSTIQQFFLDQAPDILNLAHENSTFQNAEVEIVNSNDLEFDYKITITIDYKGFFKNHTLKCYVYFKGYPRKFIWGTDTNFFKINNDADVVLEELKDKWSECFQ
ncbi:MAG: hypothetical protein JXA68_00525 [Ignavibacteriales bacterium]|nr:hypothetical protein [Ignavibacteriales bacterium]